MAKQFNKPRLLGTTITTNQTGPVRYALPDLMAMIWVPTNGAFGLFAFETAG